MLLTFEAKANGWTPDCFPDRRVVEECLT